MECMHSSAADAIGNTPLVVLNQISKDPTARILKDRAAKAMIDDAEAKRMIVPGKTVLLGNIRKHPLAVYAKIKGYKLVILMSSIASVERRALIVALGAEVDIVCFGVGSGGTVTGVGKFLREHKNEVEIYGVEPFESSVLSGLPAGLHSIQGIGAGFVPNILDTAQLTGIIRWLEGWRPRSQFWVASLRANVVAAVELAKKPENKDKLIVTTVNSSGERYLSTILYSGIKETADAMPFQSLEESIQTAQKLVPNH
ncbi:hypothetical protein PRIPAC_82557 [Pristionchus pacificus]|uniref:Uncharacterized protein n=1 Tax=Pristionchus pacificus TaxID=54126 RepID=A0A2A6CJX0_PRIPA|nr:hypothetical protein PRIPAC_82557 [Pristionchus pacificus]|eukprot:PDM78343.1 hypothetical protein PRIPAC_30922 [Pristionchus pacificus]